MFSNQPSPPIRPQVESWFNLPYLAVEDDNSNPSFDATLATVCLPYDLPQDLNLAEVAEETWSTPSSTANEGLGFHFCDICFKALKSSDFRYVSQQDLLLISTDTRS